MEIETYEILCVPKEFETLETFRDWIDSAFQKIMIEDPDFIDPDLLSLLRNVSKHQHLYPVNGTEEERGDFIGSQSALDFFIKYMCNDLLLPYPKGSLKLSLSFFSLVMFNAIIEQLLSLRQQFYIHFFPLKQSSLDYI